MRICNKALKVLKEENISYWSIEGLPEPIKGGEGGDILYYSCQERAEVSI
jgi:hypothetical protein